MIGPLCSLLVLAQRDQLSTLRAMRHGFEPGGGPSLGTGPLLAALAVLAALALILLLARWRRPQAAPPDLLAKAVRRLALSRSDLRDLRTLATRAELAEPAAMLLSPANLLHALRAAGQAEPDPDLERRLARLAERLFGTPLPEEPPPEPPGLRAAPAGAGPPDPGVPGDR